jgi:hypothetical protein
VGVGARKKQLKNKGDRKMRHIICVYCFYAVSLYAMPDHTIQMIGAIAVIAGTAFGVVRSSEESESHSILPGDAAFALTPQPA